MANGSAQTELTRMLTLTLTDQDLLRVRFAVSPLWETLALVRAHLSPVPGEPAVDRFVARHRPRLAAIDLSLLPDLLTHQGYVPDFLTPPPPGPSTDPEQPFADELDRLLATPPEVVAREIGRVHRERPAAGPARALDRPDQVTRQLGAAVSRVWTAVLAPNWRRVRDILMADVSARGRHLVAAGIEQVAGRLHPDITWRPGALMVRGPGTAVHHADGRGLLLVPSLFNGPHPTLLLDRPWQPALFYPARGRGDLARPAAEPSAALVTLLGRTRARLLAEAAAGVTTGAAARRLGLAKGTVSEHLHALRDCGLIYPVRDGRFLRYELTATGAALTGPPAGGPSTR
ncbi:ArsR family transcriptional regulator [Sphaerisporangium rufum]|uniref:ArsR family transcriptional regulator n=1 Tax=Sphaerisporangium rufum TaxID=1381558 RepID=A0A919R839_9ACTN|nr:DUF5937 family protein [Sphaerisporangium rufum]GII80161.1 ArsR family transcriptional regulator [Sphaerisporangium rufum]